MSHISGISQNRAFVLQNSPYKLPRTADGHVESFKFNGIIRPSARAALSLLSADGAHREEEKQTGLNREKEEEKDGLPEARDSKRALQFESELKNVI
ncbi:hypothetical protein Q7C36_014996 [Tachysurus vachellii]|uniref:Uncharacterized protein n=1 Tax=Tachysurus vachellii TaxID=175792 RepID=A0AA88MDS4_TACVA|nr:hypothetical protein Q7C36_014996 [Tachysurus vachellii]